MTPFSWMAVHPLFCVMKTPEGESEPDCTWRGQSDTLGRILINQRPVETAFINGRVQIEGDMSVMMRIHLGD